MKVITEWCLNLLLNGFFISTAYLWVVIFPGSSWYINNVKDYTDQEQNDEPQVSCITILRVWKIQVLLTNSYF